MMADSWDDKTANSWENGPTPTKTSAADSWENEEPTPIETSPAADGWGAAKPVEKIFNDATQPQAPKPEQRPPAHKPAAQPASTPASGKKSAKNRLKAALKKKEVLAEEEHLPEDDEDPLVRRENAAMSGVPKKEQDLLFEEETAERQVEDLFGKLAEQTADPSEEPPEEPAEQATDLSEKAAERTSKKKNKKSLRLPSLRGGKGGDDFDDGIF